MGEVPRLLKSCQDTKGDEALSSLAGRKTPQVPREDVLLSVRPHRTQLNSMMKMLPRVDKGPLYDPCSLDSVQNRNVEPLWSPG